MKKRNMCVLSAALLILPFPLMAAEKTQADADDDTLRHYLSKSEVVVVGQVTDGLQRIGVDFGSAYPVRVVEFEFKVSDGIKGKIAAKQTINVTVTRAVDIEPWIPRQGNRFVLFLKPSGKSWTSADKWFGVQPHSEAFVTHLKRLRDQPAVPPKTP